MSGKTYCILGGGGAFGIHCAIYLLQRADPKKVVGIGRNPLRPEPFNLGIRSCALYEYRTHHIVHEQDMLLEYLGELQPDVIINFAAQGEGAASWRHSWRFFDTNATALVRLYEELSRSAWVRHKGSEFRFVHVGTSELYGSVTTPAREDAPIVPSSPYAASKAAFDLYLLAMVRQGGGAPATIVRPSNCYCSGQLLHRIIPRAVVSGLLGSRVPLHGGGYARKSYLHARDLARAILLVSGDHRCVGQAYNVGPSEPTSIREVAEMCAAVVGKAFDDVFDVAPERIGQDACYWLDSSAIRALGWQPEIDWVRGLEDVVVWAKKYLTELRGWPTDYQLRA